MKKCLKHHPCLPAALQIPTKETSGTSGLAPWAAASEAPNPSLRPFCWCSALRPGAPRNGHPGLPSRWTLLEGFVFFALRVLLREIIWHLMIVFSGRWFIILDFEWLNNLKAPVTGWWNLHSLRPSPKTWTDVECTQKMAVGHDFSPAFGVTGFQPAGPSADLQYLFSRLKLCHLCLSSCLESWGRICIRNLRFPKMDRLKWGKIYPKVNHFSIETYGSAGSTFQEKPFIESIRWIRTFFPKGLRCTMSLLIITTSCWQNLQCSTKVLKAAAGSR